MLVGEGGDKTLKTGHGGSYNYKIISRGKSAHSSRPDLGINAIEKLADFITEERHLFDDAPQYPALGPFVHTITIINGGKQVNTLPDYAELRGNARPTPAFLNAEVTKRLQGLAEKLTNNGQPGSLEFHLIHSFIPVNDNPDSKAINTLSDAVEQVRGVKLEREFTNGATDASEFVKSPHHFDVPGTVRPTTARISHTRSTSTSRSSTTKTPSTFTRNSRSATSPKLKKTPAMAFLFDLK